MAGAVLAVGPCVICGGSFSFNAERVPSLITGGTRRPVCEPCVPKVNEELDRQGRPERLTILEGSYGAEVL